MEEQGKSDLTKIDELGEFGLIEQLTRDIQIQQPSTIKAAGDDAAVIFHGGKFTIVSTDMYMEGVHFDLVYTPLQHLGYKCICGSISDIYAMNGTASQVVVSIALSSKFTVEAVETIYSGMKIACKQYGVDLIGGDTTSSRSGLVINVTAMGYADEEDIVYRNTAGPKDLIVVTGDLGGAYMGLQVLEREKRVFMESPGTQPDLKGFDYILKRQLRPEARKDIIEGFKDLEIRPTAMIDISDGLSSEAMHLCKQSGTGCRLYEEKFPIDQNTYDTAVKFNIDPTLCALSGGEDYELLFTIKPEDHDKIKYNPDFTIVGHMTEDPKELTLVTKSGNHHPLQAQGWKHF